MELRWDVGTAYELFASLYVIHDPGFFGVRPSWAAGVRSRIPADSREFIAHAITYLKIPINWLYSLPSPKDGSVVVSHLESMGTEEVLPSLTCIEGCDDELSGIFSRIIDRRRWDEADVEEYIDYKNKHADKKHKIDRAGLEAWFAYWTRPEEFGTRFVDGIGEYYENFFREEERRITPALQRGLSEAQEKAERLSPTELLEELSQGIQSDQFFENETIVLIPSFWLAPLVMLGELRKNVGVMQFSSRPADASLIPGDTVPDSLSSGLQALSDHTRLKILKLISDVPLTQVEIAKKLRLRAPTINHHLNIPRLASLVSKSFPDHDPKHTRYQIRNGRVDELCREIKLFLKG